MEMLSKDDAIFETRSLLDQHGFAHWEVRISNKFKKVLGRCCYNRRRIELSAEHIEKDPVHRVIDTIRHEVAHAIAGPKAGHGPEWKKVAIQLGATPSTSADSNVKPQWQLAVVTKGIVSTHVERFSVYRYRRTDLSERFITGRPETRGKLQWVKRIDV